MKKAVVASLLAVASVAPGALYAFSQQQVNLGSGAQQGAAGAPAGGTGTDAAGGVQRLHRGN